MDRPVLTTLFPETESTTTFTTIFPSAKLLPDEKDAEVHQEDIA